METGTNIQVTITGRTPEEICKNMTAAAKAWAWKAASSTSTASGSEEMTVTATPAPKKTKKAAAPAVVEEQMDEMAALGETETTEDESSEMGFDADEVEEMPAPKAKKAAKLTDKDVNAAAMAHAKIHGRPMTLKILSGKFKVKSILELKPEQYAQVIAALKV